MTAPSHDRVVRTVGWTLLALHDARGAGRRVPLPEVSVRQPPTLPSQNKAVVQRVLRMLKTPCLAECLVLQAWNLAHGVESDLIVGVRRQGQDFAAHAWLDDRSRPSDDGGAPSSFVELHRLRPHRLESGDD